jgi:Uma2 family endonuclease
LKIVAREAILNSMNALDTLLAPVRHSPRLVEAVGVLQHQLDEEKIRRRRFYEEMTPEQKIEFIDGDVVLHSPARNKHLDATKHILKLLDTHVSIHGLGTVKAEKCLCVFPRNDYEPDVVFFGAAKAATLTEETMRFPVPDLVVEVLSESTAARDRGVKFEDYAAHGVGEYWIVDADQGILEQYLPGPEGDYLLRLKSSSGTVTSVAITGFTVEIEAFFDGTKNLAALRRLVD